MFGYVTANMNELTEAQRKRYGAVYCGICRAIHKRSGQLARLTLRYDMAFLALLLLSLYEPEETLGKGRCLTHPLLPRDWADSPVAAYCADMNVALAYWQCMDDWNDDGSRKAKWMAAALEKPYRDISQRYPLQCAAIESSLARLKALEQVNCPNPDHTAGCFGELMEALLVFQEDHWTPLLRQLGNALGRFIYLMDAAVDYRRDLSKGSYNPWIAQGTGEQPQHWEDALVLLMGRCTACFEALPLVQDKPLLDNILYSGVWVNYANARKEAKPHNGSV